MSAPIEWTCGWYEAAVRELEQTSVSESDPPTSEP